MLMGHKVFSEAEIRSRYEIMLENYCKTVVIEGRTMVDMARKEILPAVEGYTAKLASAVCAKKAVDPAIACSYESGLVKKLSGLADEMDAAAAALEEALAKVESISDITEEANMIRDVILPDMDSLRAPADKAETLTAAGDWPFPTYGELLFGV